jgi:hypothetical protein
MRRLNTRFHQNTFSVTAKNVAAFLNSIDADEELLKDEKVQALRRQHLKDMESRSIITGINGAPLQLPLVPDAPYVSPFEAEMVGQPETDEPEQAEDSVCENFELAEAC